MEKCKVDKRALVECLPDYPKIFVDKKTMKIYAERCKHGLVEIAFYSDPRGFFVRNLPDLGMFIRRGRAIALAFTKKPEYATRIVHIDGDVANDRPENLRWVPGEATPETKRRQQEKMRERMREKRETKIFLAFADGRQYWVDRDKVAHLLDLKPRARGPFKPEYYTPWTSRKGR